MFVYEKKLQYPVKVKNTNPKLAAAIISQYGGPDGELGASLRYLSQRYSMPYAELKGLLTDIGTEESVPQGYQNIGLKWRGPRWTASSARRKIQEAGRPSKSPPPPCRWCCAAPGLPPASGPP